MFLDPQCVSVIKAAACVCQHSPLPHGAPPDSVAKELDTVPQRFRVGPGLRAYLVTRASFAGLSFMRYRFTSSRKDAVFRLFTAHHTLATGFNWHKRRSGQAPGGADPEGLLDL